jgi:hypothetical protein
LTENQLLTVLYSVPTISPAPNILPPDCNFRYYWQMSLPVGFPRGRRGDSRNDSVLREVS